MNISYWIECLSQSASDNGVELTDEQLEAMASDIAGAHSVYGESTGSDPGLGGRFADLEDEYKKKLQAQERQFDRYIEHSERAVRVLMRLPYDESVRITDSGVEIGCANVRSVDL